MRVVTNDYIDAIKEFGREITVKLTINDYDSQDQLLHTWYFDDQYSSENENEDTYHMNAGGNINSVSYSYNGQLYTSIMKQCVIDINKNVYPAETGTKREIDVYFGLLVNGAYEYIDFGTFLIKEQAEQKDTESIRITCYDKLLLSMVEYNGLDIKNYVQTTDTTYQADKEYYHIVSNEYVLMVAGTDYNVGDSITGTVYEEGPYNTTLRNYIKVLANHLGLTFYNENETFPNYDRVLTQDLYLDSEGASLGYTFRDVLDDIAEATGRTFVIDDDTLKLVETPTTSVATIDEESFKNINVDFGEKYGPINKLSLTRSADSDVIYRPRQNDDPDATQTDIDGNTSISTYGETEISFKDNQLLSQDDREEWIDEIYEEILGTEYYINDYSSTGITYLEPLDRYTASIDTHTYSCLMLSDQVNITQGLEENIHTDIPNTTKTDYATSSTTDKTALQTTLIVNKQLGQIVGEVATKTDISNLQGQIDANGDAITSLGTRVTQTESDITFATTTLNDITDEDGNVTKIKNSLVTIDSDGISVQTNESQIKTTMTNDAFIISDTTGQLARFDNDGAYLDNLKVNKYFEAGNHRIEKSSGRTDWFYIGG